MKIELRVSKASFPQPNDAKLEKTFSKNYFRNTFLVPNRFDPDQARRFVGPDLVPICLQKLSADHTRI